MSTPQARRSLFSSHEIDRRWPGLPFRDFARAARLAETLLLKVEGIA
jgi:hypothetical protein